MKEFLNLKDETIIFENNLRKTFPNISLPIPLTTDALEFLEIVAILPSTKPQPTSELKTIIRDGYEVDAKGNYIQKWLEVDINQSDETTTKSEKDALLLSKIIVDLVKEEKRKITNKFNIDSEKPRVDTGLGFFVDGGRNNLQDFQTCLDMDMTSIRDADNNFQTVTLQDLQIIIDAIKLNGLSMYQDKWDKEQIIDDIANDNVLTDLEKIHSIKLKSNTNVGG